MYLFSRPAIMKYTRNNLNNRNLFFHCSGDCKFEINVRQFGIVGGLSPWLAGTCFLLYPQRFGLVWFSLCLFESLISLGMSKFPLCIMTTS